MGSMIIFIIIFSITLFFLYRNGHMTINAKRAVTFIGSIRGKGTCKASFQSCSGYMKRKMRFKESRTYHFELEAELVSGELSVEILDSEKSMLLRLDGETRSADIEVDCKKRYTLIFRFKSASGSYRMNWG